MSAAGAEPIAIIVGSGMADLHRDAAAEPATTRCGEPSAPIREVVRGGRRALFLPRHGDGHDIPPHRINYRANVLALYEAGATALICVNTVGVIPAGPEPGDLAVPAQLIDYSWGREHSYFNGGGGGVEHVDFTAPFCENLRRRLLAAAAAVDVTCHDGGVYGVTQGPRLESAAEVDRYERDGVDYLGMTLMPEAGLARELGLPAACLALIVNPAAGRGEGSLHAEIEASMATAKSRAVSVLERFLTL